MTEEKQEEGKKEEGKKEGEEQEQTPNENTNESNAAIIIAQANAASERLEKANKDLATLLQRQEELQIERTFGGTADAGSQNISKEQQELDSAKALLKGTGLEDYAFPNK